MYLKIGLVLAFLIFSSFYIYSVVIINTRKIVRSKPFLFLFRFFCLKNVNFVKKKGSSESKKAYTGSKAGTHEFWLY